MDKTACLFARYLFREAKIYFEDELILEKPDFTTERLASLVKGKIKTLGYQKVTRAVADNNNPILIADLNTLHDLTFYPTLKDELEAMVNEFRLWFGAGRVVIHPRCAEFIGCIKNGIWNAKRTAFMQSKVFGHFDALAAGMYLVRNIDAAYNPVPATFGMTRETHAIETLARAPQSESAKAIKQIFKGGQIKPMWK